jgi:hypothetical protein
MNGSNFSVRVEGAKYGTNFGQALAISYLAIYSVPVGDNHGI